MILIDQCIKLYIYNMHMNKDFNILFNFVRFAPIINTKYSWLNSLFDLGINKTVHIIMGAFAMFLIILVYGFISKMYNRSKPIDYIFIFIISGGVCSLIDKLFWNGSLDYIKFKGLFTFDLKDVYLSISEAILAVMLLFNYKNIRSLDGKKIFKDFINYVGSLLKLN